MDHRRFLKHFLTHQGVLRVYLLAATGDAVEADDLLQDVSIVLWEHFYEFDEARPFRNWALGVARIEVLKWRQQRARRREVLSEEVLESMAEAADELEQAVGEQRGLLRVCLEDLAAGVREVVKLRYMDALSIAGIAARTGRSGEAIEMVLVRARRVLRECVERKQANTLEER